MDHLKKRIPRNKGKKRICSDETKRKIGLASRSRPNGMLGKHHAEESKRKISEKREGKKHSEETKQKISESKGGEKHHLYGKHHSEETKKKMSLARKGIYTKEKHPNWKGGIYYKNIEIRQTIEYRLWREAVYTRDTWTCQKCGQMSIKLEAHHIQNFAQYPELRFAIDNGITFCKQCHVKFHKIYGRKNNTKEEMLNFINKG